MLTEVTNYNLVLFTDAAGELLLRDHFSPYYFQNPRIKIVQKPIETWHNYQYQKAWIKNHTKNTSLNGKTEWKLNMLWAEKINFVNEARVNEYFPLTDFYGWCDIGYFREGPCPTFCTTPKILALNKNKIYKQVYFSIFILVLVNNERVMRLYGIKSYLSFLGSKLES